MIRSIPRVVPRAEAPNGIVYVLTQERLLSLLDSEENAPWLTALIVDEAQAIGDGARGVLLHTAVERVRLAFPKADVIFASPLAKNPEYLLDLFACSDPMPFREEHSPVSQNVILVETVQDKPRLISCTLLLKDGQRLDLGQREIAFRFYGLSALRRLALFARALDDPADPESCCIIYANGARDAERIAYHLIRDTNPIDPPDPEITELISYVNDYINPEYGLAEVLRHGVAFHYSNMPGSVRAAVEDLFRRRKLRFLCCTSTLLQGINLPVRHILIEAPERGKDKAMERADFLNLAGRAGRLTREFHGNVWCLRPDRWEKPCYEGERLNEIRSAFDQILDDGGASILRVFEDDDQINDAATAVAALGRFFTEFIQKDRHLDLSQHGSQANIESLRETFALLENLRAEVKLPSNTFTRNSGIHPIRLETFYTYLREQPDLDAFCPIRPNTSGVNKRLREIFQWVQRFFGGVENRLYWR